MRDTEPNYYMINMQNLLHLAKELHNKGYGNLRVTPSVSPSGMSWRCEFMCGREEIFASNWLYDLGDILERQIDPTDMLQQFEREHGTFLANCKGENQRYTNWFAEMCNSLQEGELPYAFSDYFSATDHWQTNLGRKIML